jgi:hypothetical protein
MSLTGGFFVKPSSPIARECCENDTSFAGLQCSGFTVALIKFRVQKFEMQFAKARPHMRNLGQTPRQAK